MNNQTNAKKLLLESKWISVSFYIEEMVLLQKINEPLRELQWRHFKNRKIAVFDFNNLNNKNTAHSFRDLDILYRYCSRINIELSHLLS